MSDIINEILKDTPFMAKISGDCVKCGEYRKRIEELEAECDQLGADLNGTLDRAVVAESRIEAGLKLADSLNGLPGSLRFRLRMGFREALTGGKDE